MFNGYIQLYLKKHPVVRHHIRVVAFLVLGISVGVLAASYLLSEHEVGYYSENVSDSDDVLVLVSDDIPASLNIVTSGDLLHTTYVLPESKPNRLRIPGIYLDTTFENPLGLTAGQEMEVPDSFEKVGWYELGPTPGEIGPAIILGHVDSYQGAAVFYSIGQLSAEDQIYVDRDDGTTATFEVTHTGRYEQSDFPGDLVFGELDHAGLRLITCSGKYDKETLRYSHNTVVYARLVED